MKKIKKIWQHWFWPDSGSKPHTYDVFILDHNSISDSERENSIWKDEGKKIIEKFSFFEVKQFSHHFLFNRPEKKIFLVNVELPAVESRRRKRDFIFPPDEC